MQITNTSAHRPSAFDRMLRPFADVRAGEGATALLLAINVFLILTAYYVLKPVREALILGEGTAEEKAYLSAGQVLLLAVVVPLYGRLFASMNRRRLINSVTAFFIACLGVFYILGHLGVHLGVPFFLWIGIFNMMIVAQFWSFANDLYAKDDGERLFPIIGFGASAGAVFGSGFAGSFINYIGVLELLLVGAAVLFAQVLITNYVDRRERGRMRRVEETPEKVSRTKGAFALVFKTRYILLIAVMLLMHNWVKTTGEYLLGSIVRESAIAEMGVGDAEGVQRTIGSFYSTYFTYVNLGGLLLQLFVVSRIVRYFRVSFAIMVLPLISLGAYSIIAFYPLLRAVLFAKVSENATDYSLNNTVRNMLFLPLTREEKYSAKQATDTFFVRLGDVMSATLVFVGVNWFDLSARGFAMVNTVLVLIWMALVWQIGKEYRNFSSPEAPRTPTVERVAAAG
jgi:AAA family ATP:ADP antiporter